MESGTLTPDVPAGLGRSIVEPQGSFTLGGTSVPSSSPAGVRDQAAAGDDVAAGLARQRQLLRHPRMRRLVRRSA